MVILGNTKAGKSTILNEVMDGRIVLNTGAARETSFMWRLSFNAAYEEYKMDEFFHNELMPTSKLEVESFTNLSERSLQQMIKEKLSRGSTYI